MNGSSTRAIMVGLLAVSLLGARPELAPAPEPAPISRHLSGLVGAYGENDLPLYVFEREGKLFILSAGAVAGPLEEPSSDLFKVPAPGFKAGSTLTFSRDPDGTGAAVRVGSAVLGRLSLGIEGAGTYRVTPVRPVDVLDPGGPGQRRLRPSPRSCASPTSWT